MTTAKTPLALPEGYADWCSSRPRSPRRGSVLRWRSMARWCGCTDRIGHDILARQQAHGWGAKVIARLANDLKAAFPDMRGWSTSNLKYMRYFAQQCPGGQFGQQPADQLPWFHVVTLLTQVDGADQRAWYAGQVLRQGWSRSTLELQIKNQLHARQGGAVRSPVAGA